MSLKIVVFLTAILVILGSLNGVNAHINTTCLDDNTLQINKTKITILNGQTINETSFDSQFCNLGCSNIDGAKCRTVVEGAIPVELYLFFEIMAFIFLIITFTREMEDMDFEQVIWPLLTAALFMITGFTSISVHSPTLGATFTSTYLLWFNFFMGFFMIIISLLFAFMTLRKAGGDNG